MQDLNGKKVLITGASGAIGAQIAKTLHQRGAEVAISGTRLESLNALANELGSRCHVLTCDLGNAEAVNDLYTKAEAAMGSVDVLVNNAGMNRDNLMIRMKDEDWDAVLNVNLGSVFRLSRSALKSMMKNRWGRIINITSVVGVTGNAGQANYSAAKAGMIGMSKSLAKEVASRGITVNCVAPGFIESPMTAKLPENYRDELLSQIPVGRMGSPEDIAEAVAYLASPCANYVTGQTIHVNGGMAMV